MNENEFKETLKESGPKNLSRAQKDEQWEALQKRIKSQSIPLPDRMGVRASVAAVIVFLFVWTLRPGKQNSMVEDVSDEVLISYLYEDSFPYEEEESDFDDVF